MGPGVGVAPALAGPCWHCRSPLSGWEARQLRELLMGRRLGDSSCCRLQPPVLADGVGRQEAVVVSRRQPVRLLHCRRRAASGAALSPARCAVPSADAVPLRSLTPWMMHQWHGNREAGVRGGGAASLAAHRAALHDAAARTLAPRPEGSGCRPSAFRRSHPTLHLPQRHPPSCARPSSASSSPSSKTRWPPWPAGPARPWPLPSSPAAQQAGPEAATEAEPRRGTPSCRAARERRRRRRVRARAAPPGD